MLIKIGESSPDLKQVKQLSKILNVRYDSIDEAVKPIIDELEQVDMYKDGGSIMYKNNDIAILKCNTVSGNKDIYIGKSNLRYESDYCK